MREKIYVIEKLKDFEISMFERERERESWFLYVLEIRPKIGVKTKLELESNTKMII